MLAYVEMPLENNLPLPSVVTLARERNSVELKGVPGGKVSGLLLSLFTMFTLVIVDI